MDVTTLLSTLNSIAALNASYVKEVGNVRASLYVLQEIPGGLPGPLSSSAGLIEQLQSEILAAVNAGFAVSDYIAAVNRWVANDSTYVTLGVARKDFPGIPQAVRNYAATFGITLADLPTPPAPQPMPVVKGFPGMAAQGGAPTADSPFKGLL